MDKQARLEELKGELEKANKVITEAEQTIQKTTETALRISGAIMIMSEVIESEKEPIGAAE